MPLTAIALGSNLGDREANLREAIKQLGVLGQVTAISKFRETAPVGFVNQPEFLNAVALLDTDLRPQDLMQALLNIEQIMGRDRTAAPPKGPRLIDLDLVLYSDQKVTTSGLTVPHPEMPNRRFVLEPLAEVAPEWIDPISGRSAKDLFHALADLSKRG